MLRLRKLLRRINAWRDWDKFTCNRSKWYKIQVLFGRKHSPSFETWLVDAGYYGDVFNVHVASTKDNGD